MAKQQNIAKEDIFIDGKGKVVKAGSPDAAIKVVAKGAVIPPRIAEQYDLNESADEKADVTKSDSAARKSGAAKKSS